MLACVKAKIRARMIENINFSYIALNHSGKHHLHIECTNAKTKLLNINFITCSNAEIWRPEN